MQTEQEKLIGTHPDPSHFVGKWLSHDDRNIPHDRPNHKHRKLSEINGKRTDAINEIAKWIVEHHVDIKRIARIRDRKTEICAKYNITIEDYLDAMQIFPKSDNVRKGNGTEIILAQYLRSSTGYDLLAYKLTYNPNVEQAMKGDDCLLFNLKNLSSNIVTGEAKFRSTPSKAVVKEITENLQQGKLPISLPFISKHFSIQGDQDMAGKIEDLLFEVSTGRVPITNVGLLLSSCGTGISSDAGMRIDADLNNSNPNMVMISLGLEQPQQILDEAFTLALGIIKSMV